MQTLPALMLPTTTTATIAGPILVLRFGVPSAPWHLLAQEATSWAVVMIADIEMSILSIEGNVCHHLFLPLLLPLPLAAGPPIMFSQMGGGSKAQAEEGCGATCLTHAEPHKRSTVENMRSRLTPAPTLRTPLAPNTPPRMYAGQNCKGFSTPQTCKLGATAYGLLLQVLLRQILYHKSHHLFIFLCGPSCLLYQLRSLRF